MAREDREEFIEEFTPFDSWEEFMKQRAEYKDEDTDKPAS